MDESRTRTLLDESGLDALVAVSLENVAYLSGSWIVTQRAIPDRLAIVLWPRDGKPAFVLCKGEDVSIVDTNRITDTRTYVEFKTTPVELLAEVIQEKGLQNANVAIELKSISAADYAELKDRLPDTRFVDAGPVFDRIRMVKTADEIEALGSAARVTEKAIRAAFEAAAGGVSEKVVADDMSTAVMAGGADVMNFLFLGSGDRSFQWHAIPGAGKFQPGHMVHTDIGGSFGGYWSDVARTVVVGKPTAKQRDLYGRLAQVHTTTIEGIRPGMPASELHRLCGSAYEEVGLPYWMAHIGHGIGLALHEHPMLNPANDQELLPGMVLCIEPAHLDQGVAGYHVEDLVLVTETGAEVLTDIETSRELFSIG